MCDKIITFKESFIIEKPNYTFDDKSWVYLPKFYLPYRYILGTKGENPLICIGINPSTAAPGDLDNTLKSVERIAKANGYDSFLMLNISPQRATNPNNMVHTLNSVLISSNIEAFEYALEKSKSKHIWLACGTLIRKRGYLFEILKEFFSISTRYKAKWLVAGALSQNGDPHHPLYLKKDEQLKAFDICSYIKNYEK